MKNLKFLDVEKSSRATTIVVWLLIGFSVLLAYRNSFIQDDAFISFRYASNLVHSGELTWNPGQEQKVEGYTNFLWTIMMAAPIALGRDPVAASKFIGLLFLVGTLLFTYKLSRLIFQRSSPALLSLALLGANYSFSAYATGGLETQMQACLIVVSVYLAFLIVAQNRWGAVTLAGYSLSLAASLLTRLDSAILLCVPFVTVVLRLTRQPVSMRGRLRAAGWLTLPAFCIVGAWLAWKLFYYGNILPNTYYIKGSILSLETMTTGIVYIATFLQSYFLTPFVFLALVFIGRLLSHRQARILAASGGLWCLYVIKVGGCFMEFRLLVPMLPFLFVLVAGLIHLVAQKKIRVALSAMILAGSLCHAMTFNGIPSRMVETIGGLNYHIVNKNENWRKIGLVLKELFSESEEPVRIATTAAGAIPYYSRLSTVDMLGLNDAWIARHGGSISSRAGHTRVSTFDYLVQQRVNLVISHPLVLPTSKTWRTAYSVSDLNRFTLANANIARLPETAKVVEIPFDPDFKITALYLCPNSRIDETIRQMNLKTIDISRP